MQKEKGIQSLPSQDKRVGQKREYATEKGVWDKMRASILSRNRLDWIEVQNSRGYNLGIELVGPGCTENATNKQYSEH